ncbi:MAG: hypothetical protein KDD64_04435 [Bdellovibrionales bacterium]|nr:hypothetical protein [Bdellovibrionales bacterium]
MVLTPLPPTYVSQILNGEISVEVTSKKHIPLLLELGARRGWILRNHFILHYEGDAQLAPLLDALRQMGVAFLSVPHGWPPSAIFDLLREKGLLVGECTRVTFTENGPQVISHSDQ